MLQRGEKLLLRGIEEEREYHIIQYSGTEQNEQVDEETENPSLHDRAPLLQRREYLMLLAHTVIRIFRMWSPVPPG